MRISIKPNLDCVVSSCTNKSWQGAFNGLLCTPCYHNIIDQLDFTKNRNSTVNTEIRNKCKYYLEQSEHYKVKETIENM